MQDHSNPTLDFLKDRSPRFKNLIGNQYDRLTVIAFSHIHKTPKRALAYWLCHCECGNEKSIAGPHLRKGLTRSCGCLQIETTRQLNFKHGYSNKRHPQFYLYALWVEIRSRCLDPTDINYPTYGGWGVPMEKEWKTDSGLFISHILSTIGNRPTPKHSIDRIINAKGYTKGNLKWSTAAEQNRNKTTTRLITAGNRTQCLADWAKEIGKSSRLISIRISKLGWTEAEAVEVVQRTRALPTPWSRRGAERSK